MAASLFVIKYIKNNLLQAAKKPLHKTVLQRGLNRSSRISTTSRRILKKNSLYNNHRCKAKILGNPQLPDDAPNKIPPRFYSVCVESPSQTPTSPLGVLGALSGSASCPDTMPDLKRFLSEVGTDPREARYWLKQFTTSEPKKPFAVVQLDPEIFRDKQQLDKLASCLAFLQRNSMRAAVVCGGHRDTCSVLSVQDIQKLRRLSVYQITELINKLEAHGVSCRPLFVGSQVIQAQKNDSYSGSVSDVDPEVIEWCFLTGHIPVIQAFGETPTGQIVSLDLWSVTEGLSRALQPLKVIKVNTRGGFVDETGTVVANIHLPGDLVMCGEKSWYTPAIKTATERIYQLLLSLPSESSVVLTSVDKMLKELFTHRGSGTFFKITEPIHSYTTWDGIDLDRLAELFTRSFKKTLSKDYFTSINGKLHTVYLSENYNAAALVLKETDIGVPYLCKFVVSVKAQGEGTGEMLWEALRKDQEQLFWRSKGDNRINSWYFRRSEGSWSNGTWTVFWYGIHQPSLASKLIESALNRTQSFISSPIIVKASPEG